jgi:hypothetical protein
VLQALRDKRWSFALVEAGLGGALREKLERVRVPAESVLVLPETCPPEALRQNVARFQQERHVQVGLGLSLERASEKNILHLVIATPQGASEQTRSYGGEQALVAPWAVNTGLELLRRNVLG